MQEETILFSDLKRLPFHPCVFPHMTSIKEKVKKLFGFGFDFLQDGLQFCFNHLRMVRRLAHFDFSPSYRQCSKSSDPFPFLLSADVPSTLL